MTESPEEGGMGRLPKLIGCLAPVLLIFAGLRIVRLIAGKRQAAWLAGRSWPPEAISVFFRGPARRPPRRG
jgi:hypothetical protein